LHQPIHVLDVLADDFDELLLLLRQRAGQALDEQIRVALHRGHRLFELVRDEGDEFRLGLIGALHLLKQARVINGDGGMFGKAADEIHRLWGEDVLIGRLEGEDADHAVFPLDGNGELRPHVGDQGLVAGIGADVRDEGHLPGAHRRADQAALQGPQLALPVRLQHFGGIATIGEHAQAAGAVLVFVQRGNHAYRRPGDAGGPFEGEVHHLGVVQAGIEHPINVLERRELFHPRLEGLIGHGEEARIFDGDGRLRPERQEQLRVFLVEGMAILRVEDFQHADGVPPRVEGNRQDGAGDKIRAAIHTRIPARIAAGIGDDDGTILGKGGADDALAGGDFAAHQLVAQRPAGDAEDEIAAVLVEEQQGARLGVEQFDRVAHDQVEHLINVEAGGQQPPDLIEGIQLVSAGLETVLQASPLDGGGGECRDRYEEALVLLGKTELRFLGAGDHHADDLIAGHERRAEPGAVEPPAGFDAPGRAFLHIISGADHLPRLHHLPGQTGGDGPGDGGVEPLVAFNVKGIRQLRPFGIGEGDVEIRRLQYPLRLRVDELHDVIYRHGEIGGLHDPMQCLQFEFVTFQMGPDGRQGCLVHTHLLRK